MKPSTAKTSAGPTSLAPLAVAVAAALGSQGLAPVASAQDAGVPIETIVVTASRRETTVQELPFNISAFSGELLEQQRLTHLSDFSRWVPGLTVVNQGPRAADIMTVRGLNVRSVNSSEFLGNSGGDTVSTYLGEIPLYLDLKMKDIDRVEVLIGPQGTLYGAGTLGGAVRYIPKAPDTRELTFDFSGDVFSLAESSGVGYETDFVVNAPIVEDKLAFRASFSYLDDPGFIDYPYLVREPGVSNPQPDFNDPADVAANLWRKDDADTEQTLSARASLLWEASDSVRATFNYYFQDQEAGSRTVNHRSSFGTGEYESAHRFLEPNDRENSLMSVEVVADLGFAELTSATGVSSFDEVGQRDQTDLLLDSPWGYDAFPFFAAFTREIVTEDRINQELRLVSTGARRLSWIAGIFYNDLELDSSSEEFAPEYPEFLGLAPPPLPTGDLEYLFLVNQDLKERAVFGEISYQVSDRLDFAVGGRFFDFETEQSVYVDTPFFPFPSEQPNRAQDDGFLGKINASYAFSDSLTGYATLSEGYRVGGANSIPECANPLPPGQNVCAYPDEILIKPDITTNFELGVHSAFNGGRVQLNAALYTIDWDDIQTLSVTENGQQPITVNGGSARSNGLEVSFAVVSDGPWSFRGSYAYNDAKLTSDAPGLVGGADAFSGDRLSGTPEHQGSFLVGYGKTLDNGWDVDFTYGLTSTSNVLTKVGMRDNGEILSGYTLHGASVSLGKDRWLATLYAENLTNKFAETGVRLDPSYIRDVSGFDLRRYFRNVIRPRTIGIEFRYALGD